MLDLDPPACLSAVGLSGREPNLEALTELHEARVHTFPFENFDVLLGNHPGVALSAVHHFTSTAAVSHFTHRLILTRHLEGRHVTVTHETVTVRRPGQPTEHRPLRRRHHPAPTPPTGHSIPARAR